MSEVIQRDGLEYTIVELANSEKIEIRHPKGRDLKFAMNHNNGANMGDIVFSLASTLSCKSVEEIEDMNIKDTSKIINVVSGFFRLRHTHEGVAMIGHILNFTYSETMNMQVNEYSGYLKIATDIYKVKQGIDK